MSRRASRQSFLSVFHHYRVHLTFLQMQVSPWPWRGFFWLPLFQNHLICCQTHRGHKFHHALPKEIDHFISDFTIAFFPSPFPYQSRHPRNPTQEGGGHPSPSLQALVQWCDPEGAEKVAYTPYIRRAERAAAAPLTAGPRPWKCSSLVPNVLINHRRFFHFIRS